MICKGCREEFQGIAAYCPRCEMKQLADSVSSAPAPSNSSASMAPSLDFDKLYRREGGFQPKRNSQHRSGEGKTPSFLLGFALLAAACFAAAPLSSAKFGIASAIGYTMGVMLSALIIAGICRLFTKGGFGKIFLIVLSVMVALNGLATVLATIGIIPTQSASALDSQKNAIRRLVGIAKGMPVPSQSTASAVPDSRPYVEPDGDALTNVINQVTAALSQYNQHVAELNSEQRALGVGEILAPHSLVTKAGIQHGRDVVASYSKILDDYQASYDAYVAKVQQVFNSAPPASRQRLILAFQKNVAETRDAMSSFLYFEHQIISTVTSVLDLAQANLGVSRAQGNVIYLPQRALLNYRQDMASLQALVYQDKAASDRLTDIRRMAISQLATLNKTYDAQ